MSPVRVLIADDEAEIREALADAVAADGSLELVGVAPDADGAIHLACHHLPDVALLDVRMPGGGGARAVREIRACSPQTKIVALSAHEDRTTVLEMIRAGAAGYIVKGAPLREIVATIHGAVLGQGALSSEVAGEVIHELAGRLEREAREEEARRQQAERIRGAIAGGGLTMVFQPIADLYSGQVLGVEALARFSGEPYRGPNVWFAQAAEVGLRADLELAAARAAIGHHDRVPGESYLSINLSPETLTSQGFPETLEGVPPERLVIEVTEHAPVPDYEALAAALRSFREGGGRLAVDDAGAGFASLRHILRLGPDLIKLDVDLTRDVHADRARRALAAALTLFAKEIGATIVAEGIETESELEALRGLGVACGQGYYLARPGPLPVPEIALSSTVAPFPTEPRRMRPSPGPGGR